MIYGEYIFKAMSQADDREATARGWDELVRCKECKHWDGYFCHNKCWGDGYGNYTPPIKTEEGYCDCAERKEEHKEISKG